MQNVKESIDKKQKQFSEMQSQITISVNKNLNKKEGFLKKMTNNDISRWKSADLKIL